MLLNKDNPLVLADIGKGPDSLPDLHFSKVFKDSPALKEFRVVYNSLSVITKLCLLCFAAIPANEAIKKRVLVHWWVGEGFVNPPVDGEQTAEKIADGIFQELTEKGCIEPVYKKRRSVVHSFKMHHLIRSAVTVIASEVGFFNFDAKGNPTANFSSHSYRACLVNRDFCAEDSRHLMGKNRPRNLDQSTANRPHDSDQIMANRPHDSDQNMANDSDQNMANRPHDSDQNVANRPHDLNQNMANTRHDLDPKMLQTVFNVNESYPDFSNVDWSKLRNLKVLHLGRWHSRAKHHIELLPETIGSLKNLTHLDMSECYLLERMPKGIALLSELQVLKGFVVGDHYTSCTFHDLSALKKLRKLSINTSRENFPSEEELIVLQRFGSLRKLTIAWGRLSSQAASTQDNAAPQSATRTRRKNHMIRKSPTFKGMRNSTATSNQEYFKKLDLEKLDLQCYPQKTAPSWLRPGKLKSLKKLYIRGGPLRNLFKVQENEDKWAVETLRLKFLSELEMDWKEIPVSFPDLIYLEKFRCPRLTFFPTDESGVWLKP
ncbi:disease resistance RPP13-like protein 4 [Prunus yedoensis var. nudiflora]|uniref:Disease resistance RPP13-like protein 4 n=1 Tax=Prunus yedoensis var. nudiflora TaxID=2094558 RepID=A0A314UC34_PRUYE|nr:disease resistance RPP13-like protein 4 [Prunus yedoensis var. nudiflora]